MGWWVRAAEGGGTRAVGEVLDGFGSSEMLIERSLGGVDMGLGLKVCSVEEGFTKALLWSGQRERRACGGWSQGFLGHCSAAW